MSLAELVLSPQLRDAGRAHGRRERRLTSCTSLVVDGGCDVRLRGCGHADLVRVALLEWLPLSPAELAQCEDEASGQPAPVCLASLVRPPTIWPFGEALAAALLLAEEPSCEGMPFPWLAAHASGRVNGVHVTRVRARAARIALQLPLAELPCSSAAVRVACALVEHDDAACVAIAALALARFSLSEVVTREVAVLCLP